MTDEEWFYNMCDRMNKMPTEAQLEAFLEAVNTMSRIKAFVLVMRL